MQLQYLFLSTLLIPVFGLGRECCCDRYSQFSFSNAGDIVAQCKRTWAAVRNGQSGEDYCNSAYCIQQQEWWNAGALSKCVVAGYQCGKS